MGSSGSSRSSAMVSGDVPMTSPRRWSSWARSWSAWSRKDAEVGPPPQQVVDLAQHRPGGGHVGEGEVGPDQLQPGLDRVVGQGVGGLWPQLLGPRQVLVGLAQVAVVDGHPGRRRVQHDAGHAVLQMRRGDHRSRLLDQGLGVLPVLAADGQDGPLGQGDAGGDGRAGVLGHLDRLGQDVVGHAQVAGQQVRDPQQQLRRRPPEAAHRDQRQGQLGVGPHLGDPVAAQLGPQQGPPAVDRGAAVGQPPLVGSPSRPRRPTARPRPRGRPAPGPRPRAWPPRDTAGSARGRRTSRTSAGRWPAGRCGRRRWPPARRPGRPGRHRRRPSRSRSRPRPARAARTIGPPGG